MNLLRRTTALLVDPAREWATIEREPGDPAYVLSRYVTALAAIPALASFVGASLIGELLPDGSNVHAPIFNGAFGAIFGYALSCITVLLLGLIVTLIAPLFAGKRDFENGFKLAAYSFTPVWLAGVFLVLPGLHFLLLTGFYGAYLLWLGLPRLTKAPPTQALNFAVVIVICGFALTYFSAVAQRVVFGTPGL